MNYKCWQTVRLWSLGSCSLAILVSLVINLTVEPSSYQFPKSSLDDWETIDTERIEHRGKKLEGRRDRREISGNNLTLEMYYIPKNYQDNEELIQQYRLKSLTEITIKNSDLGYYGLSTQERKTHLNACIHSQGKTAFTKQQFAKLVNQNVRDRLLPWILGLSDLRDWGCLWVNLSVPLEKISEPEAYSLLERQLVALVSEIYPTE